MSTPLRWFGPRRVVFTLLALVLTPIDARDCASVVAPGEDAVTEWLLAVDAGEADAQLRHVLRSSDGRLWLDRGTLSQWRLSDIPSASLPYAGQHWHALDDIAGLRYRHDACTQSLHVDLAATGRRSVSHSLMGRGEATPLSEVAPGGYFNADLLYSGGDGADRAAGFFELGVFGRGGRGLQTAVADDRGGFTRLDSTWLIESPESLATVALGDSTSSAGSWGRTVRYAGLRWATDFSLQPYFVPFPQPVLAGQTALPSTLDVFINDSLRARQPVDGGPFELQDVPAISGGGEAVIVVRDALGRETRVTQPFYVSPQLLHPGLADYALDVGFLRRDYGLASAAYGDAFGTLTYRYGLHPTLTAELRGEWQAGGGALGASALYRVGYLGLVSATTAYGGSDGTGGGFGAFGLERDIAGRYGLSLRREWAQAEFRRVGDAPDQSAPRYRDFARINAVLPPRASLSLTYSKEAARGGRDLQLLNLGGSLQIAQGLQVGLQLGEVRAEGTRDRRAIATLSYAFAGGVSAALQHQQVAAQPSRTLASVQRTPAGALGWGYRGEIERGPVEVGSAALDYGGNVGTLSFAASQRDGATGLRAGARTGLAWLGGDVFWTRPVRGSFAVVDLGALDDTGVYLDNRLIARSNLEGVALLPDLRPYESNRIGIRAENLPIEQPVATLTQTVVPRGRSGVRVDFTHDRRVGIEVMLRDEDGEPVPAGSALHDRASGTPHPVGHGGRAWLRLEPGAHTLRAGSGATTCEASLQVPAQPDLGMPIELVCRAIAP